jgi:hypothetical protein
MLNHVQSWLNVGWFEILRDTRRTTGFIWAQVWQCDRFGGRRCTCALINWMILLYIYIYIYIYNLISTIYIIPSESTDETTGVSSKPVHYLTECCYLFQDQDMPYACICMNKRNVGPMSFVCAHTSIGLQIFVPQISPAVETHAFTCTYLYSTVYIWN